MNPHGIVARPTFDRAEINDWTATTKAARDAYLAEQEAAATYAARAAGKLAGPCADCTKVRAYAGRGLCNGCYGRHRRTGTLENFRRMK